MTLLRPLWAHSLLLNTPDNTVRKISVCKLISVCEKWRGQPECLFLPVAPFPALQRMVPEWGKREIARWNTEMGTPYLRDYLTGEGDKSRMMEREWRGKGAGYIGKGGVYSSVRGRWGWRRGWVASRGGLEGAERDKEISEAPTLLTLLLSPWCVRLPQGVCHAPRIGIPPHPPS